MFLFLAASLVDADHQCHASNQSDFFLTVSYPSLVDIVKFAIIIIIYYINTRILCVCVCVCL